MKKVENSSVSISAQRITIYISMKKRIFTTYNGNKMDKIENVRGNMFLKVFPCEKCDFKSKGLEQNMQHFDNKHNGIEYSMKCVFTNCDYETKKNKVTHETLRGKT